MARRRSAGWSVLSLAIIVWFALPSLVDGNNAVSVALVTAGAVAIVALYLAHGVGPATDVALLSTFASLALTGLLAWIFVEVGNFTGLTDDASFVLQSLETGIDPRGILLAGIVIGSLGVLDDVTVTQVSAVWELHRSRPEAGPRALFMSALKIGRDHISSTVNTLFLAYAGAALPLLLLFTGVGESLSGVATPRSWRPNRAGAGRLDRSRRVSPDQHVARRPRRDGPAGTTPRQTYTTPPPELQ